MAGASPGSHFGDLEARTEGLGSHLGAIVGTIVDFLLVCWRPFPEGLRLSMFDMLGMCLSYRTCEFVAGRGRNL